MVTMQHQATTNTAMLAYGKRLLYPLATRRAILRSERGGYFPYPSASAFSLADEYLKKSIPRRITYRFGKTMIFHHPFDVQIFNLDVIKLLDNMIGEFVEKVSALVRNLLMLSRQYASHLTTVRAVPFLLANLALRYLQRAFRLTQIFRILYCLTSRERREVFKPNVYPHTLASSRNIRRVAFFDSEYHKPAIHLPLEGASLYAACDLTRQAQPDRANFGELKFIAFEFESGLRIGEAVIARFGFEARESCFICACFDFPKEVLKSSFAALQDVLQYLRMHLADIGTRCFYSRQFKALVGKTQRFTSHAIGISTLLKGSIVQLAAYLKCPLKLKLDTLRWFQFELVGFQSSGL